MFSPRSSWPEARVYGLERADPLRRVGIYFSQRAKSAVNPVFLVCLVRRNEVTCAPKRRHGHTRLVISAGEDMMFFLIRTWNFVSDLDDLDSILFVSLPSFLIGK